MSQHPSPRWAGPLGVNRNISPPLPARAAAQVSLPNFLTGFAASPGRARGPVTVVHPDKAPSAPSSGTIVVCPVLSRTVLTAHPGALAFVAEGGGALSLAASQARQAGIPAVAGVDRATAALRDCDVIEVDGSEGTVRILARGLP